MSLKSLVPLAAAVAISSAALRGCVINSPSSSPSSTESSSPAAAASPEASGSSASSDQKTDASVPFTINDSGTKVRIPDGTTKVVINGSNLEVDGDDVTEITVSGSNNHIDVDSVQHVSFTGSNNVIEYDNGNAPHVTSDTGTNNTVTNN